MGEVQWSVFKIPTIYFHVHLYSYLSDKFAKVSVNDTDDEIRKTNVFKNNIAKYETGFSRYYKFNPPVNPGTETLPTYMRNLIDHPEPQRNLFNNEEEFSDKLAESVQFMIDIIKEKGW